MKRIVVVVGHRGTIFGVQWITVVDAIVERFRGQRIVPSEEGKVLRDDVSGSEVKHEEECQRLGPARMASIQV